MNKRNGKIVRLVTALGLAVGLIGVGVPGAGAAPTSFTVPAPEVDNVSAYSPDWLGVAIEVTRPHEVLDFCYYWEVFFFNTVSNELEEYSSDGCHYPYFANYMWITVDGLSFDSLNGFGAIRMQAADYYSLEPVSPWSSWAPIDDTEAPVPEISNAITVNLDTVEVSAWPPSSGHLFGYCYEWEVRYHDPVTGNFVEYSSDGDCLYPYFWGTLYLSVDTPPGASYDYGEVRLQANSYYPNVPVAPWSEWAPIYVYTW